MYPMQLNPGDEIRVIAPSRSMCILDQSVIDLALTRLQELKLKVSFGRNVNCIQPYYNCATVDERLDDLHEAFSDPNIKGILTVVGGYNVNQLLPEIDYDLIRKNPKIICGLSDITAMQNAIYARTGLVTFSGPHFSNFGMVKGFEYSLDYFTKMLFSGCDSVNVSDSDTYSSDIWFMDQEKRMFLPNEGMTAIFHGQASGTIVGGNLCTLNLLQGTPYMPDLKGKILFLEDTGALNSNFMLEFDRNLESLLQCEGASGIRGLVIGRAESNCEMTQEKWRSLLYGKKALWDIPVIVNANIGHTTPIFTFPIGGYCTIQASEEHCEIILGKGGTENG